MAAIADVPRAAADAMVVFGTSDDGREMSVVELDEGEASSSSTALREALRGAACNPNDGEASPEAVWNDLSEQSVKH